MSKTPSAGKPLLQPAVLSFFKTRLDADEIARRVDNRPLAELESQVADAFRQILVRAHAGDDNALFSYFKTVRQAVMSFENLVTHEPDRLSAIAAQSSHLPVLLSLNPQDIEAAKERLRLLKVGTKAILPTRPGQRTDWRIYWTQLAIFAFNACNENIRIMPTIEAQLTGAKQSRVKCKYWETDVLGTEYTLSNGDKLTVADWQKDCAKLAGKVTADNLKQWREIIKLCVLEFWNRKTTDYHAALKIVGKTGELESTRRHSAMNRTLQAFKSQFLQR